MARYVNLRAGDPAPWFHARSGSNPNYAFDTAGGRYIVLCFFASAGDPQSKKALETVVRRRAVFDDIRACFFGVSLDPADESAARVADSVPGIRYFWDFDAKVSKLYGAAPDDEPPSDGKVAVRRVWYVLDPTMRILRSSRSPTTAATPTRSSTSSRPCRRRAALPASRSRHRSWCCPTSSSRSSARQLIGLYENARRRGIGLHARGRRQDRHRSTTTATSGAGLPHRGRGDHQGDSSASSAASCPRS